MGLVSNGSTSQPVVSASSPVATPRQQALGTGNQMGHLQPPIPALQAAKGLARGWAVGGHVVGPAHPNLQQHHQSHQYNVGQPPAPTEWAMSINEWASGHCSQPLGLGPSVKVMPGSLWSGVCGVKAGRPGAKGNRGCRKFQPVTMGNNSPQNAWEQIVVTPQSTRVTALGLVIGPVSCREF